jgi:hypothetical protein
MKRSLRAHIPLPAPSSLENVTSLSTGQKAPDPGERYKACAMYLGSTLAYVNKHRDSLSKTDVDNMSLLVITGVHLQWDSRNSIYGLSSSDNCRGTYIEPMHNIADMKRLVRNKPTHHSFWPPAYESLRLRDEDAAAALGRTREEAAEGALALENGAA